MYIRHTLHKIVTAVHFIDTRGHSLLAVKMNNTTASEDEGTNEDAFDLFVYECESEVRKATRLKVTLHKINTNYCWPHHHLVCGHAHSHH